MSDKSAKAERYAQAMLQALIEKWQAVFSQVAETLSKDRELYALLMDGSREFDDRAKALEKVIPADAPSEFVNLLKLMLQEDDLDLLPELPSALAGVAAGQRQPIRAEVVSAVELSEAEKESLRETLSKQYDRELVFHFSVDPALMGGLRVRIGDRLIDMSVASRLAALRESVTSVVR